MQPVLQITDESQVSKKKKTMFTRKNKLENKCCCCYTFELGLGRSSWTINTR